MYLTINFERVKGLMSFIKRYEIYLDNKKIETNDTGSNVTINLEDGEHKITLLQPLSSRQVLDFIPNHNDITITLTPAINLTRLVITLIATIVWYFAMYLLNFQNWQFLSLFWVILLFSSIQYWINILLTVETLTNTNNV